MQPIFNRFEELESIDQQKIFRLIIVIHPSFAPKINYSWSKQPIWLLQILTIYTERYRIGNNIYIK